MRLVEAILAEGLDIIINKYVLKSKRHTVYNNLILLKYNQIESPRKHEIVDSCRGIILDEANNYNVVCYPYNRFYNYNEGVSESIDWSSSKIYEKLDGSLMTLYYYNNDWHVSTSGTPDALGSVQDNLTFKDLFWNIWNNLNYKLPQETNFCYMFEMVSPLNTIIVKHKEDVLYLHGARNLSTLQEVDPIVIAQKYNWKHAPIYNFNNLSSLLDVLKNVEPTQQEGFVVCDKNFNRIKIKSEQYVALHHLATSCIENSMSDLRLITIIQNNEGSEFLNYFPKYKERHTQLTEKFQELYQKIITSYNQAPLNVSQKDFALYVQQYKWKALLFSFRNGRINSFLEGLREMRAEYVLDWLRS